MAHMIIDRPTTTLPELQRDVVDFVNDLGPASDGFVMLGIDIGVLETPVAHGITGTPRAVFAMPHTSDTISRTRASDARFVYLKSTSSTTADLLVIP